MSRTTVARSTATGGPSQTSVLDDAERLAVRAAITGGDVAEAEALIEQVVGGHEEAAARAALLDAANDLPVTVSRSALLVTMPQCHKRQCSCAHPTADEAVQIIVDRFRDALRTRALLGADVD